MGSISIHHNYLTSNFARNPAITGDGPTEFVNNVIYNWGDGTDGGSQIQNRGAGAAVNFIGNHYKAGPDTSRSRYEVFVDEAGRYAGVKEQLPQMMYMKDNFGPHRTSSTQAEWAIVGYCGNCTVPAPTSFQRSSPWPSSAYPITISPAQANVANVLNNVGATLPARDAVDARLVAEYHAGTGSIGGDNTWPVLASGTPPADTDHDGMPDQWETSKGLNPYNAADRNAVAASGYTNLEVYLAGTGATTDPSPSDDTTSPPAVSITAPVNGSTVSGSAVTVSANASDNVGVASVDFKVDGTTTLTDTTSPYAMIWNSTTATNGSHTFTALARDAAGNVTTSTGVSVTVNNASPPTTNKFVIGDRVQAIASINVRGTPGGTLLYTQPMDALGTVIAGPTQTPNGVIWWQIDYDSGTDGWSGEDNLVKYTPPPGLVAAYKFEEASGSTVVDASGKGNTGTISGASRITEGRFGKALSFDGVDDWVTINDAPSLDLTTGMTLEAWVYPTVDMTQWATVILKEQPGGALYELHANGDQSQPLTSVTVGGRHRVLSGGPWLLANQWTHLAATYDGTMQRLYVNGTQVAQRPQTGPIQVSSSPLRMGGNSVWGEFFQGRIDEVRVYNRALNATEIQTDMNRSVPR